MNDRNTRAVFPAVVGIGLSAVVFGGGAVGAEPPKADSVASSPPRELGRIAWLRGFDSAARKAAASNKALLTLFQEVPGCDTCVGYGDRVLSHPLIVDAAETLFVPVAVYNSIKGDDERTLKSFDEPAWNNPVVRILTPDRKALAPRVADDYTVAGLATAMVAALKKQKREAPPYLALLAEEASARRRGLRKATFAMHCFWEGEGALGEVPGVISTMPGFLQKKEIVEIEFDPSVIGYGALVEKAKAMDCASEIFARSDGQKAVAAKLMGSAAVRTDEPIKPDKAPKYYISRTPYRHVPMTGLQAARVNALVGKKKDARHLLSPRQKKLLDIATKHPTAAWPAAIGEDDLPRAWQAAVQVARSVGGDL